MVHPTVAAHRQEGQEAVRPHLAAARHRVRPMQAAAAVAALQSPEEDHPEGHPEGHPVGHPEGQSHLWVTNLPWAIWTTWAMMTQTNSLTESKG